MADERIPKKETRLSGFPLADPDESDPDEPDSVLAPGSLLHRHVKKKPVPGLMARAAARKPSNVPSAASKKAKVYDSAGETPSPAAAGRGAGARAPPAAAVRGAGARAPPAAAGRGAGARAPAAPDARGGPIRPGRLEYDSSSGEEDN